MAAIVRIPDKPVANATSAKLNQKDMNASASRTEKLQPHPELGPTGIDSKMKGNFSLVETGRGKNHVLSRGPKIGAKEVVQTLQTVPSARFPPEKTRLRHQKG
ncbi:hypothetical protein M514_03070 [Trichuris suis]|uniref:Uncharacterized protein n=1 Tax=Trichuris suis TaxID=68888 RepID=A0A085MFF0_9BILA|nr:hypothetical protein M513_03070 [Trichuris suis]KFD68295.1 hypothetical protein M514_03070 [Trichuris suis]